jgi:RNA 3'-terminal phosphate cyclase (ATP)
LKAVDAAASISRAHVEGAALNSTSLVFEPGEVRTGRYKLDIGTAGSTSLVLQTIFAPLSLAASSSTVIITGGTHVPWSPCYHYLDMHWLHYMNLIGFDAQISLEAAGFYPQGGGRVDATIRPAGSTHAIHLQDRGRLTAIRGISAVSNLDPGIAERQKKQALRRLQPRYPQTHIKITKLPSPVKGTLLLLLAEFEPVPGNQAGQACFFSLGELGKPAERVADEAVDQLETFLESDGVIDQYLADQLLLPLSLTSAPSIIHSSRITQHLLTNAQVIQAFSSATIDIQGEIGVSGIVSISPNRLSPDSRRLQH